MGLNPEGIDMKEEEITITLKGDAAIAYLRGESLVALRYKGEPDVEGVKEHEVPEASEGQGPTPKEAKESAKPKAEKAESVPKKATKGKKPKWDDVTEALGKWHKQLGGGTGAVNAIEDVLLAELDIKPGQIRKPDELKHLTAEILALINEHLE
jgi:hypothetical protein